MPKWRNWQTRYVQGVVSKALVRVQISPSAQTQPNRLRFLLSEKQPRGPLRRWYNSCNGFKQMKSILEKIKQIKWADRRVFLVIAIVILVFLMMDFNNRMVRSLKLEKQEQQLISRVAALEQTKQQLLADIAYANSDRAVEEWAREEAKLINEGDIPIVVRPQTGAAAAATPAPPAETEALSHLEIWKQLFWGD